MVSRRVGDQIYLLPRHAGGYRLSARAIWGDVRVAAGVRPRRRTGITRRFTHLGCAQADRELEPSERQGAYANGKITFSNTEKACENALRGDVEGKGRRLTEGR